MRVKKELKNWMKMAEKILLLTNFSILMVLSCRQYNDYVVRNIIDISKTHDNIDLSLITNFKWDNVVLCTPGIRQNELDLILPGEKKRIVDIRHILAFINNGKIVYKLYYSANPDKPFPFTFSLNGRYLIVKKENAQFRVKRFNKYIVLEHE